MISLSMKIQPRCSVRHQKMQTKTSVKYNLSLIRNKCKIIVKYPDTIPILRVIGKEVSNNTKKALVKAEFYESQDKRNHLRDQN